VPLVDAAKYAQENECLFFEGSAKTGENIEEAFAKLGNTVMYKIDSGDIPEDLVNSTSSKSAAKVSAPTSLSNEKL
jgi:hypothetical protein